jgi:hypothetical protein
MADDEISDGIYTKQHHVLTSKEFKDLQDRCNKLDDSLVDYLLDKGNAFHKHSTSNSTLGEIFDIYMAPLIQNWENLVKTIMEVLKVTEKYPDEAELEEVRGKDLGPTV